MPVIATATGSTPPAPSGMIATRLRAISPIMPVPPSTPVNTPDAKIIVVNSTTLLPCAANSSCCCVQFGRFTITAMTKAITNRTSRSASWASSTTRSASVSTRLNQNRAGSPRVRTALAGTRSSSSMTPSRFRSVWPMRYAATSTHTMPAAIAGMAGTNTWALSRCSAAIAAAVGPPHGTMFITPAPSATTPASASLRIPSLR
jgi:hypothetical protein